MPQNDISVQLSETLFIEGLLNFDCAHVLWRNPQPDLWARKIWQDKFPFSRKTPRAGPGLYGGHSCRSLPESAYVLIFDFSKNKKNLSTEVKHVIRRQWWKLRSVSKNDHSPTETIQLCDSPRLELPHKTTVRESRSDWKATSPQRARERDQKEREERPEPDCDHTLPKM